MKTLETIRMLACVWMPAVSVAVRAEVANDQCASARFISEAALPYQSSNAPANSSDDAEAACQPDSGSDVWFRYMASCTGVVTIDTLGSPQADTALSVYSSCGGTEIACNDDVDEGFWSRVSINSTVSDAMWIRLASVGEPGDYKLNVSCVAAPTNDVCASASGVTDGHSVAIGNNLLADATDDAEAGCQEFSGNDVWFAYAATCTGRVTVDTFGSAQIDPILSVYDACGGAEIACNDDAAGGLSSQVSFDGAIGQTYQIRLASVGEAGDYRLNIECVDPPANDSCTSAVSMADGMMAAIGNNVLASPTDDAEAECQTLSDNDVWFEYVASCSGLVTVNTLGSLQVDPLLSVYQTCGGLEIACNDDSNGKLQSALSFVATEGQSYRVRLASVGEPGEYALNVQCLNFPANDNCASAIVVVNGTPAFAGNNQLASTMDDTESTCQPLSDYDVWFTYESTCDGAVTINTFDSAQGDTTLVVYDACSGGEVACNDDAGGTLHSEVSFATSIGQTYRIRFASVGEPGDYSLNVSCVSVPANDACISAIVLTDGAPAIESHNLLADAVDDVEAACQPDSSGDVWFEYTSACAGVVTIDTSGTTQVDSVLSVYEACGGIEIACNDDSSASLQARVMFNAMMNQTVWIRLASAGALGEFQLNIGCASPPTNEACSSAIPISDGAPAVAGSNLLASVTDDREADCQSLSDGDVWFQYVASCTGLARVDTIGSGQSDTVLSAYLACGAVEVACNDDTSDGLLAGISFDVTSGASYFIRLASVGEPGGFDVNVACLGVPMNDTCASATIVETESPAATGNNSLAAATDDAEASCGSESNGDVWFQYVAQCSNTVLIDTFGSEQDDTILSVYGACGGTEIACNDDTGGGLSSSLSFAAAKGQNYWIRLGSMGAAGEFILNITTTTVCRKFGDINNDQVVDLDDILCVLAAFGGNYACADGLANADFLPCNGGNGEIDLEDILAVLQAFSGADLCP